MNKAVKVKQLRIHSGGTEWCRMADTEKNRVKDQTEKGLKLSGQGVYI